MADESYLSQGHRTLADYAQSECVGPKGACVHSDFIRCVELKGQNQRRADQGPLSPVVLTRPGNQLAAPDVRATDNRTRLVSPPS